MLTFDLLTLGVVTIGLLTGLFRGLRKTALPWALAGVALLSVLAHLATEGARWQMVPVYIVLTAWLALLLAKALRGPRTWLESRPRWQIASGRTLGYALLVIAASASYLFPMFRLPPPSGPFPVGTTALDLTDSARYELHTVYPFDRRELVVRVWYPAAPATAGAQPVSYMDNADVMSPALAKGYSLPLPFVFTHFKLIPTHSFLNAPLSTREPTYPVVVFSHGRDVYAVANTALMEDLASRGYVVFAIDHAYGTTASAFPDGRVVNFVNDVYEEHGARQKISPEEEKRAQDAYTSTDVQELTAVILQARRLAPEQGALNRYGLAIWSGDQRFVIDEIEKLQSGRTQSVFAGHLDLSKLGVAGMSYGGSTTVVTCTSDPRCKAGVSLDGFSPDLISLPVPQQPFMYASGDEQNFNLALAARGLNWSYWLKIINSRHGDYTDLPLVTPLWKLIGLSGSITPNRVLAITNTYVAAFFDKHLRSLPAPLLEGPSRDYPEVRFQVKRPATTAPAP